MTTTVRLTLAEYDAMLAQGILDESRHQHIELIQGEMREMSPPGPMHEDIVDYLNRWSCNNTDPAEVRVRVQNSIGIPEFDSAPMPDVAWVREQSYRTGRPQPSDVHLIVEVSDSSLAIDRGAKAELYASAGVQDYWIVNLQDWCVEVYRDPSAGGYREKRTFDGDDTVSPLAFPNVSLNLAELFRR